MRILVILLISSLLVFSFKQTDNNTLGYDFENASESINLPDQLHEISGLTIIDSVTIACIQDEEGILFTYELISRKIKKQQPFANNGDYEGITRVGNTLYILRSDGVLFEIQDYRQDKLQVKTILTGIPAINNEGLCYDLKTNCLLIGAKGKINSDEGYKDKRVIYEYNLSTKKLNESPLYNFSVMQINTFAKNNNYNFEKRKTKKGKTVENSLKLNTSEIAIHPITKKLYVLSATDHCLFIFNTNGDLEHIVPLNKTIFNKAEGLAFFENGDMLISNEGQKKLPTLLKFNYSN